MPGHCSGSREGIEKFNEQLMFHLIDINAVAGLDLLAVRDEILHIGARARHAAFHRPAQDGPLGVMLS